MKYLVFNEDCPAYKRPFEAATAKDAVRQWVDIQAKVWEGEDMQAIAIDDNGVESRWSVRAEFAFHITEHL